MTHRFTLLELGPFRTRGSLTNSLAAMSGKGRMLLRIVEKYTDWSDDLYLQKPFILFLSYNDTGT